MGRGGDGYGPQRRGSANGRWAREGQVLGSNPSASYGTLNNSPVAPSKAAPVRLYSWQARPPRRPPSGYSNGSGGGGDGWGLLSGLPELHRGSSLDARGSSARQVLEAALALAEAASEKEEANGAFSLGPG